MIVSKSSISKSNPPAYTVISKNKLVRIIAGVIVAAISFVPIWVGGEIFVIFMALILIYGIKEIMEANPEIGKIQLRTAAILILIIYIVSIILLRLGESGKWYALFFVSAATLSDIFGWLVGTKWGRIKIFPRVSPDKSLEGTLAAIIAPVVIVGIFLQLILKLSLAVYPTILIFSIAAVIGDLLESYLKRQLAIKNSSQSETIPGHGGILDRTDANLFCGCLLYILLITGILFLLYQAIDKIIRL